MTHSASHPTIEGLYSLFSGATDRPTVTAISPTEMPEPYRSLLVHSHHMTVTVEQFYGQSVHVRVLDTRINGNDYARKILLSLANDGRVVQFGIVHIDLSILADSVRNEIVAGQTPLGRVLIEHDVLRYIEPAGYIRVQPCRQMCDWFGISEAQTTYGRLGVIFTDGKPTIEVLEILAPIPIIV